MGLNYNQNYTKKQIDAILDKIRDCICSDRYEISLNNKRKENKQFMKDYRITNNRQKEILLGIKTEDFCHTLKNTKAGFRNETLYVFAPQIQLVNILDEAEAVDLYTKFNIIDSKPDEMTVVISFHKRNKPITYLFR